MSKTIGTVKCPFSHVCGNQQADVRRDKKGHPYIICYECDPPSQHFSYGRAQRVKALALDAFVAAPAPAPAPKPALVDPPAAPKKKGIFDDLKL